MIRTTALNQLAAEIRETRRQQYFPGPEALARWDALAQQLLAEAREEWESEPAFRMRTGASTRWCSRNFQRFLERGLSRRSARGKREWHVSARAPRPHAADDQGIVEEIAESYGRGVAV